MRVELVAVRVVSLIAANAAGKPIRVGFEAGPFPRATMAPASFKTTHSVFVPPPSNPKTHFIGQAYARTGVSGAEARERVSKIGQDMGIASMHLPRCMDSELSSLTPACLDSILNVFRNITILN